MENSVTTKREQSQRWISLALEVIEGKADTIRNPASNKKTRSITLGIIKTLMGGFALSSKQQTAFIDNISNRVPGKSGFTYEGEIKLTKKQITDAKANPKYASILEELEGPKKWIGDVQQMLDYTTRKMEYMAEDPDELQSALSELWLHIKEFYDLLPQDIQ